MKIKSFQTKIFKYNFFTTAKINYITGDKNNRVVNNGESMHFEVKIQFKDSHSITAIKLLVKLDTLKSS